MEQPAAPAFENRLLAMVDRMTYTVLAVSLERVRLEASQILYKPENPIEHVYFPITAVASLIAHAGETEGIEVATVGNEGVVGLPLFLAADLIPGSAVAQIPREASRVSANDFRRAVQVPGALTQFLHR